MDSTHYFWPTDSEPIDVAPTSPVNLSYGTYTRRLQLGAVVVMLTDAQFDQLQAAVRAAAVPADVDADR